MTKLQRPTSQRLIPKDAEKVFSGEIFDVYQWEQELYDGSTATFEKLVRPDTVNIFPVTPNKKIIITRQEQPGVPEYLGCVGGRVDKGEEPLSAAKREMLEESGYSSETIVPWYSVQPSFHIEWSIYSYIAKNAKQVQEPHPDAGEKIELLEVTFDEFVDIVQQENYRDKEVTIKILRAKAQNRLEKIRELFIS